MIVIVIMIHIHTSARTTNRLPFPIHNQSFFPMHNQSFCPYFRAVAAVTTLCPTPP